MAAAPFGCCVKSRRGSFHLPGGSLFRYGRNMLPSAMAEPKKRGEAIRRLVQLGLTVRPDEGASPKPHGDKLAVPARRAAGGRRTVGLGEPEEPDEQ